MSRNDLLELVMEWRENVFDNSGAIDPLEEEYWPSVALGFALGKGKSVEDAREFTTYIKFGMVHRLT